MSKSTTTAPLDVFQQVTHVVTILGALVSFGLMLQVGQYRFTALMLLFAGWDLAPFAGLMVASSLSKRWPVIVRATLYGVMLLVAVASMVIYGRVVWKQLPQPAFAFLVVPLASWVLLVIAVLIAHVIARKVLGQHVPLFRK